MSFDIEIHGQKITLTNEDVEEIYRVQEREYRLCDARSAFQNRYEYHHLSVVQKNERDLFDRTSPFSLCCFH